MKTDNKQVRLTFDAAIAARNAGDVEAAKLLCMQALEQTSESEERLRGMVYGELGYVHELRGEPELRLECYRRSVALAPRAELSSLGLFHTLVEQQRWMEGLEEAVRFLTIRDSPEYRELFSGRFGEGMAPPFTALVDEARRLLAAWARKS